MEARSFIFFRENGYWLTFLESIYQKKSMPTKTALTLSLLVIILLSLLPGCGENKEEQAVRKRKTKTALTIIRNDDCLNCHSIEDKSVGPAYTKIAQRYDSDFSTVNRLAKKIVEGGGGLWGSEQMSKHPLLKSNDAAELSDGYSLWMTR